MSDIKQYDPLWGTWQVDSLLGEGSYGKVYKVHREEFGKTYEAAVKMISIPQNDAELRAAKSEGLDSVSARSYFHAFVTDIVQEIALMNEFRGNSNIVSLEDHKVIEKEGEIGWDILIRMELLTTLSDYVTRRPLNEADVVKLGVHICRALELCAVKKLIHRDIKPDNIFVSQFGDYKLGDFGIARQVERTMSGLSKKGTYTYMAPEVFRGGEYGASVDLYSLGIVMYRFLNGNRTPFLPKLPEVITPHDREEALQRRMSGEPLPPIEGIDPRLNEIVLKACAYERDDRFRDATEMKIALTALLGEEQAALETPLPELPARDELTSMTVVDASVNADDQEQSTARDALHWQDQDPDEDEGTLGMFSKPMPSQPLQEVEPSEIKRPRQPLRKLAIVGEVLFSLLGLLTFVSGNKSDMIIFSPLYLFCLAQCILRFDNKLVNSVFLASLAAYLAFAVSRDFRFLDYSFLILTASLFSLEAVRIGKRKYQIALCASLIFLALFSGGFIARLGLRVSYAQAARAAAVPLLLLLFSPASLLVERQREKGCGLLMALQFFLFLSFAAYSLNRASVFFYIADASFIGFSPERFAWWRYGRFAGVLLQFFAFASLLVLTAEKFTPEQYQYVLDKENRGKILLVFGASIVVMTIGLGVIRWIPLFAS